MRFFGMSLHSCVGSSLIPPVRNRVALTCDAVDCVWFAAATFLVKITMALFVIGARAHVGFVGSIHFIYSPVQTLRGPSGQRKPRRAIEP